MCNYLEFHFWPAYMRLKRSVSEDASSAYVDNSPIASVQTSGILISARGHFLSKIAFVIVRFFFLFSKIAGEKDALF